MTNKVLACITTRNGTPPTGVREHLEEAMRVAFHAGHGSLLTLPEDRYSVAACRNKAVADLLQSDCTHILFVDDDVYVPQNALVDLLAMDRGVAAGVYPSIKKEHPAFDEQAAGADDIHRMNSVEPVAKPLPVFPDNEVRLCLQIAGVFFLD